MIAYIAKIISLVAFVVAGLILFLNQSDTIAYHSNGVLIRVGGLVLVGTVLGILSYFWAKQDD